MPARGRVFLDIECEMMVRTSLRKGFLNIFDINITSSVILPLFINAITSQSLNSYRWR
jgi:hypothetical protein